jgi:hypothetical protein
LESNIVATLRFAASFSEDWILVVPLLEVRRFQEAALALAQNDPNFSGSDAEPENRQLLGRAFMSTSFIASSTRDFPKTLNYAEQAAVIAETCEDLETVVAVRAIQMFYSAYTGGREIVKQWLDEEYVNCPANTGMLKKYYSR